MPDPPPQATTGTPCAVAIRSATATASSVRGIATTSGRPSGVPFARAAIAGQYVSAVYASSCASSDVHGVGAEHVHQGGGELHQLRYRRLHLLTAELALAFNCCQDHV